MGAPQRSIFLQEAFFAFRRTLSCSQLDQTVSIYFFLFQRETFLRVASFIQKSDAKTSKTFEQTYSLEWKTLENGC